MKLFRIVLSAAAVILLAASCNKVEMNMLSPESEYKAPVLNAPASINLTAAVLAKDEDITFSWTKADFGQPAEITYNINASYGGKTTVMFAILRGSDSYTVKASELGAKLTDLGVPHSKTVSVTFNMDCTIGSNFTTLKSADKAISVYVE
jgi:hypothetical protein